MDYKLELVLIPVSDVDRAERLYLEDAGFGLIVDTPIGEGKKVVSDMFAARAELIGQGVAVSAARHLESGAWVDRPHPERAGYQPFADFKDPDGNVWILPEVDPGKASHGPR